MSLTCMLTYASVHSLLAVLESPGIRKIVVARVGHNSVIPTAADPVNVEELSLAHVRLPSKMGRLTRFMTTMVGSLRHLSLVGCELGGKGARLANLLSSAFSAPVMTTQLEVLNISHNSIGGDGASALAGCVKRICICASAHVCADLSTHCVHLTRSFCGHS